MWRAQGDGGQAVSFVLAFAGMAVALTMALATVAGDVIDVGRARTAADAAALAGAAAGRAAAARLAAANGAAVVAWSRDGATVTVTVRVGDAEATARATLDPPP